MLTIGGNRPKSPKAIAPTAYAQVDPATMRDEYFVAIERRNFFNIYSLESFMIAFGRDGELDRITAPVNFKSTDMPKDVEILGARFTALSEVAGTAVDEGADSLYRWRPKTTGLITAAGLDDQLVSLGLSEADHARVTHANALNFLHLSRSMSVYN